MARALSVHNILNKKRKLLEFTEEWFDLIGKPELKGLWIVYGHSGHGKTSFIMQLIKYLCGFCRVLFNSLEEGDGESIRLALIENKMSEVSGKLVITEESLPELRTRLKMHKSPDVVVVDSVQYFDASIREIKALCKEFPNKIFIYISHQEGKHPQGTTARGVKYHAHVKIFVQGFASFCLSRFKRGGQGKPYLIWPERAKEYHALNLDNPNYNTLD